MSVPLVVPLDGLEPSLLSIAGGKAVNLGELIRAGLPVPGGVCVTTEAYALAAQALDLDAAIGELDGVESEQLATQAAAIRAKFEHAPVPAQIAQAVESAVAELGTTAKLAVRSSATAEDLPFASFAGQQDTYLNMAGPEQTIDAVRRCWASLWTERAVVYRHNQAIDQHTVRLAVVIQRMVDASVAGVLFTANPLTGKRGEAVVEAHPGLGEAVVSGAVNPDHWTIDSGGGQVLEGPSDGCLSHAQLQTLAALGKRVERHFGAPQDIEFAFDQDGTPWLVQTRAITTLYPLPWTDASGLRVYLSFNVAQGVFRPLTPLGIDAFRLLGNSLASAFGIQRTTPILKDAGMRLFLDLTTALRSPLWQPIVRIGLEQAEARSGALIDQVVRDPRLAAQRTSRRGALAPLARAMWRSRLPLRVARALVAPKAASDEITRLRRAIESTGQVAASAGPRERLAVAEQLLTVWPPVLLPRVGSLLVSGLGSFALAKRLMGDQATDDEFDTVRRALPHNPTTEMDLRLWSLSRAVRRDSAAHAALQSQSPTALAEAFAAGTLPPVLQRGLAAFLAQYGHRAIAEIDLGVPRWSEDPTPLLGNLANYLAIEDGPQSPEAQFRSAAAEADRTVDALARRAALRSPRRARIVRFLLRRARAVAGLREMPKFLIVLLLARARALLLGVGRDLVQSGRVDAPDDVCFLTFPEIHEALDGVAVRERIAQRRARYAEELRRRHVPRLLLSDGTEPSLAIDDAGDADGLLHGTPASAGRVTGRARVILEPAGAKLEPGDILVAPSTDPGWTPLFLSAAGLVMEMGGAMSHGAVVAREYGIPAVVGVPSASERIQDGESITVDGSQGTVSRAG